MASGSSTDYLALLKDTVDRGVKQTDNIVPLLVGALITVLCTPITLGVLGPPLALGYSTMCLKVARGEAASLDDLWSGFSRFVPALIMGLIAAVAVVIGLALLVVPGVALMILFTFAFHFMATDPDAEPVECLKSSVMLVKDNAIDVLVLWLFGVIVSAVLTSTLAGIFVVTPFVSLLSAVLFVKLDAKVGATAAPSAL